MLATRHTWQKTVTHCDFMMAISSVDANINSEEGDTDPAVDPLRHNV